MIRVLIVEDQGLVRGALASLLSLEEDIEVIGEAGDGEEGIRLALRDEPDIALVDIEIPKVSGLDVVETLHRQAPNCRCIIVTTFARPGYLQRAMKAGAMGYMLKDAKVEDLARSIREVYRGGKVINHELMLEAWSQDNPLGDREIVILQLAAQGMATKEIAQSIFLSEGTVRNYLSEIMSKLDVSTRQEAIRMATSKGWL
ncbi:response regulator transcription factor [Alicyclobacillus curvatus]|jgi:two-component system, NarL family, response regulator DesR|nr:response regulator transcription factor [Alicyclobacillus curvatus]